MKLTGSYNGKPIELELTEEQVELLRPKRKKTGWERVKWGQGYCYTNSYGEIEETNDSYSEFVDKRFDCANYFADEALDENITRAQALQRKLWRRSAELCEKVDWENSKAEKYHIFYNYENDNFCVGLCFSSRGLEEIYFDTKEHAKQVIEEFHDELIWYFTKFESRMD